MLQVSEEHMLDKHPEKESRVSLPELEDELAPISDEETRSVIKVEEFMDKMLSINLITGSSLV